MSVMLGTKGIIGMTEMLGMLGLEGIETFFFSSKELSPKPSLLPEDRLDPGQRNCCT